MLKIDSNSRRFVPIGRRTLDIHSFFSHYRLADFVENSGAAFFQEMARPWMLLGRDWKIASGERRVDLVAVDRDGRLHVFAEQLGDRRPDLIDPLEVASRLAQWTAQRVIRHLDPETLERLRSFLDVPIERLNAEQGVVMLAESFDSETLATAGWLRDRYGVRLECFRVLMAEDSRTNRRYLVCEDLATRLGPAYRQRQSDEADGAPWPLVFPADREGTGESYGVSEETATTLAPPVPATHRTAADGSTLEEATATSCGPAPANRSPRPEQASEVIRVEQQRTLDPEGPPEPPEELADLDELPDDPLAELVRAHKEYGSGATQPTAELRTGLEDRRRSKRRSDFHARRLRLDYLGRLLGARLVDVSEHGIGVEALSPLPVGSEVEISGELIGSEGATLEVEGRVRVEHCHTNPDGVCRIGFSIENAKVSEIDSDEQAFGRR